MRLELRIESGECRIKTKRVFENLRLRPDPPSPLKKGEPEFGVADLRYEEISLSTGKSF
jgi:hypothetical protein